MLSLVNLYSADRMAESSKLIEDENKVENISQFSTNIDKSRFDVEAEKRISSQAYKQAAEKAFFEIDPTISNVLN